MTNFNLNAKRVLEVLNKQVATANYRARSLGLDDTFTIDQWLTILNHWHWHCAICNIESRDLSPDHWIPLSNDACPGSTYDNIVPLCEGCNSSKNRTEPVVWLTRRLGDEIASHKISEIRQGLQTLNTPGRAYNTTIPEQAWINPPKDDSPPQRQVLRVVFDMTDPEEKEMWRIFTANANLSPDEFGQYIKNLLWLNSHFEVGQIYRGPQQ